MLGIILTLSKTLQVFLMLILSMALLQKELIGLLTNLILGEL